MKMYVRAQQQIGRRKKSMRKFVQPVSVIWSFTCTHHIHEIHFLSCVFVFRIQAYAVWDHGDLNGASAVGCGDSQTSGK